MFCDRCGATVQPEQRFCSRCGKDFSAAIAPAQPPSNRVQQHIRLLGILWLVLAGISAVAGLVMCLVATTLFAHLHEMGAPAEMPAGFLSSLFTVIGIFILAKGAVEFLAGWGLLHRKPWARLLTIVLAFLALLNLPFGTALGIFSLWVLLPAESEREYQQASRSDVA